MQIIVKQQLPHSSSGVYAHYLHKKIKNDTWDYLDVRKHVNKNEIKWLNHIDNWHAKLSAVGLDFCKWWWLLNCSRLVSWHPPFLKPLFFAYALIELIEENKTKNIILIKCPQEVIYYIKEFRPDIQIVNFEKNIFMTLLWKFKRSLKQSFFTQQVSLLKQIISVLVSAYRTKKQYLDIKELK